MSKIITITFNPAVDKSTTVVALNPEMKLTCTQPVFEAGGGGINVARAIKKLGGTATALYMVGGYTGNVFTELLNQEGITGVATQIRANTRENLTVLETSTNRQYRFGMPGPTVLRSEWQNCLTHIEHNIQAGFIVISGALPQAAPADLYNKIAFLARGKNAKIIVDASGDALKHAVQAGVYLLKPNLSELSSLVGNEVLSVEEVEIAAKQVINKWKCEVVMVSMGAKGAMLVTCDFAKHIMPPAVKIKSTVGAGDSMVAGIVLSLANNKSIIEAAKYGVACGTAATLNMGTQLCSKEDSDRLFQLIQSYN